MAEFDSDTDISNIGHVEVRIAGEGARHKNHYCMSMSRVLCENCIRSGSPLCRGLTRDTYILCIEHPRPMGLSQESNLGPAALHAITLCKEPRRY